MESLSDSETEQGLSEESIWKKNTRLFYCVMICQKLDWPSLTIDWLSYKGNEEKLGYTTHRIAYGTYTSSQEPENIIIDSVKIPNDSITKQEIETIVRNNKVFSNLVMMNIHGEPNKIRQHPYIDFTVACKSSNGNVYIYDYSKVSGNSSKGLTIVLNGHDEEGYGLSWNSFNGGENLLASGSYDKKICCWDYSSLKAEPIWTYLHQDLIEDVTWIGPNNLISVSDDKTLIQSDIRSNSSVLFQDQHEGCINSVDCNKLNPVQLLTSSSDHTIKTWDIRFLSSPINTIPTSYETYLSKWAPFSDHILAYTTSNNKITIYDTQKQSSIFTHEGHFARINEFSWNQHEQFLIASVDEENIMQVWCMHPGYLDS